MNLKQAAQRLEVHYQTAYRWVRDGQLVAIKVGNRYEVTESAIQQFVSRRASLLSGSVDRHVAAVEPEAVADDEIAELRVLARETRATAQPCFDAATVVVGTRVGDGAVLRLLDISGCELRPVASFAAAAEVRASVVGAVAAAGSFPRTTAHWLSAEQSGEVHIVHHMPRDFVQELFGEEGRFAGHGVRVLAAAVAPMFVDGGFVGGLLAVKTQSHLPFSDSQISLLGVVAELCSHAHGNAEAFRRTWQSNKALNERVGNWLAAGAALSEAPTSGTDLFDATRPQALLSLEGSVLVSNEPYARATRSMTPRPEAFAERWDGARVREVVEGVAAQVDISAWGGNDPGAIVSAVRRPDAEVQLLVVDVIAF